MDARTKFLKSYWRLPKDARSLLTVLYRGDRFSLNVVRMEVDQGTEMGNHFLKELGFVDDDFEYDYVKACPECSTELVINYCNECDVFWNFQDEFERVKL